MIFVKTYRLWYKRHQRVIFSLSSFSLSIDILTKIKLHNIFISLNRYANTPLFGAQYLPPLSRPPLFGAPLYATSPAHFHSLFANLTAPEPPRLSPEQSTLSPEHPRLSPEHPRLSPEHTRSPSLSPPISPGSEMPVPTEDVRSSSIAALRMAAREHELRLELLRQRPDLICWYVE